MSDITKNQLYITQLSRVVETNLTKRYIPMDKPHSRDTFLYILSGTCIFTIDNGEVFQIRAGDVVYLAKNQDYSLEVTSDDYRYIVCDFHFRTSKNNQALHIRVNNPAQYERLFRKLLKVFSISAPDRRIRSMALLYEIYSLMIQNNQDMYVPGSARVRIETARAYIQENITDPNLSVAQLAKTAQMSEVHFRKLFSNLYNCTPSKYILQHRVSYSQKLMGLNELQLEDIALQSGFSSLPHFCRVFKNITGTTPAVFRRNLPVE